MTMPALSLWPREHGTTVQCLVTLVATLAVAPLSWRASALGLAFGCLFLASEPILVLLGKRGPEIRTHLRRPALLRLGLLGVAGAGGFGAAWSGLPLLHLASLLPSALGAGLLGVLFFRGRGYSAWGELSASAALASLALPLLVVAGRPMGPALGFTLALVTLFGLATVSVRLMLRSRTSDAPWRLRILVPVGALGAIALAKDLADMGHLPTWTPLAFLPLALATGSFCLVLSMRLKTVGWILAAGTGSGAAILVAAFRLP